jgi:hypothetical protein
LTPGARRTAMVAHRQGRPRTVRQIRALHTIGENVRRSKVPQRSDVLPTVGGLNAPSPATTPGDEHTELLRRGVSVRDGSSLCSILGCCMRMASRRSRRKPTHVGHVARPSDQFARELGLGSSDVNKKIGSSPPVGSCLRRAAPCQRSTSCTGATSLKKRAQARSHPTHSSDAGLDVPRMRGVLRAVLGVSVSVGGSEEWA